MKTLSFALLISFFAVTGCNNAGNETTEGTENTTTVTPAPPAEQYSPPPTQETQNQMGDTMNMGNPGGNMGGNTGGGQTGQLNPPHGEPGHRCDIAVGAPLP